MKKIFLIILLCLKIQFLLAAIPLPIKASEAEKDKSVLSVARVSNMRFREFQVYTGQKSTIKNRIAFLLLKKELKQQVKAGNGDQNISAALQQMENEGRFRLKLVGLAAGLFLGIFGVGLTYIFTKDKNIHRSAWIGFSILAIVALSTLFSIFPA